MARKKTPSELETAELRYRSLVEKRDFYNQKASAVVGEIESTKGQKNNILDEIDALRDRRAKLFDELDEHKKKRGALQKKAKEMIELKKASKGKVVGGLEREVARLKNEIDEMKMRQQTATLSLKDEEKLLDSLRDRIKELGGKEKLLGEQDDVIKEVKNLDLSINELFEKADIEHEAVVKLSSEARETKEKITKLMTDVARFFADNKKKSEIYMELRKKADAFHQKAMEMREKIITIKRASGEEAREARKAVQAINVETRKALDDKKKIDKKVDEALEKLLKSGKIEIRG